MKSQSHFNCGHKRSAENIRRKGKYAQCRICLRQRNSRHLRRFHYGDSSGKHYESQAKKQKGLCAICQEVAAKALCQDHDHSCCPRNKAGANVVRSCGKCLRGLLCNRCNLVLGYIEESLLSVTILGSKNQWLVKAQAYLLLWKSAHAKQKEVV